jgi:hypothetical protein
VTVFVSALAEKLASTLLLSIQVMRMLFCFGLAHLEAFAAISQAA